MIEVLFVEHSVGNFPDKKTGELIPYDNLIILAKEYIEQKDHTVHEKARMYKFKSKDVEFVPKEGDTIKVYFDAYQNPTDLRITEYAVQIK